VSVCVGVCQYVFWYTRPIRSKQILRECVGWRRSGTRTMAIHSCRATLSISFGANALTSQKRRNTRSMPVSIVYVLRSRGSSSVHDQHSDDEPSYTTA
jgi:hypothetical protein